MHRLILFGKTIVMEKIINQNNIINSPRRIFILLLAVLTLYCLEVVADDDLIKTEYSYRRYTIHDGLTDMICYTMYQDSKGFIWVGQSSGFVCYDGYAFHPFHANSDETVVDFYEDSDGNVSGLTIGRRLQAIFERDTISSHTTITSIEDMFCYYNSRSMPIGYGIFQEGNAKAIYAIKDSGIVKTMQHETLNKQLWWRKPYWDIDGKQFFIPTPDGTYVVGEDGILRDSFPITSINCFVPHKGGFWAVANDGLYEYNNHELKRVFEYPFASNNIEVELSILEDLDKNLIIRTKNNIYKYAESKIEIIARDISYTSDMIIDREGNLWVSTADGLYNFYRLNFKKHTLLRKEDFIWSVLAHKQNQIWLASIEGDLINIRDGEEKKIEYPLSTNKQLGFDGKSIIDGDDMYLIGVRCVLHYNIKNHEFKWLNLPDDIYYYVTPMPDGRLVIGSRGTVYIYAHDKGVVRKYEAKDTNQKNYAIVVDKQGRILLGGARGVVVIDGDSIRKITDERIKLCKNMLYDQSGKLWLTCKNNIISMDADESISVVHTFPNTTIRNLHITKDNIMMVATNDAIYLSKKPDKNLVFIRYDQYNGFNALGMMTSSSIAEDEKGNIWLPTSECVVQFNYRELLSKQPAPLLYLQSMQSSKDNISWENVDSEYISELEYLNNNVKFKYVGLCYSATGNIRYQYRLKGFQEEWSDPLPEREVTFNNLPPGRYEFQLKANAGADGTETDIVSQYFTIYPAFWQTWWFMTLVVLTLLLITTGITINIQRRKNKYLIERLETEKQLNELRVKSIRLRSIPHFNANVLSAIEYYIMNLSKEEANRLLNIYSDFTSRTLREVDKASRSLTDELEYVQLYLKLEKLRFLEKFNYEINIGPEVNKDVQLPNMILHTYCENAVKHGLSSCSSGGLLKISARQKDEDIVEVCVEDNGVGRVAAAQNKNMRSTKQGLDILSRQIEIYNRFNKKQIVQRIDDLFNGDIPCGTRFVIEVPYGFGYQ